jgi:hypothetical protein
MSDAGKGDDPRNVGPKFREHFDQIDWSDIDHRADRHVSSTGTKTRITYGKRVQSQELDFKDFVGVPESDPSFAFFEDSIRRTALGQPQITPEQFADSFRKAGECDSVLGLSGFGEPKAALRMEVFKDRTVRLTDSDREQLATTLGSSGPATDN